jgi:hypothetical protein
MFDLTLSPFAPRIALPWTVLGVGAYLAWKFLYGKKGEMNGERKAAFALGMRLTDPVKINLLADAFDKGGLPDQAKQLRNRANLGNVSQDTQMQRAGILKQALNSTDPNAVDKIADAFEKQGAASTAKLLRDYAAGLRANSKIPPVVIPVETPQPAPAPIPESSDSSDNTPQIRVAT